MNRICTICARGGSKGVKNKNIRDLLDIPLIAHSIIQAKKSSMFEVIAVSSDSNDILAIAKEYGADLLIERPKELATDQAAKLPVIQHCVKVSEEKLDRKFDIVVDLDATSPLRSIEDIVQSLTQFEGNKDATNLITGAPARRSPYFNLVEVIDSYVSLSKPLEKGIVRRQDAPKSYDMNASIYIWRRESLLKSTSVFQSNTILYEMPEERSIDIDSELDFEFVSFLAKKRGELV
ncbi:cytidylyltransferase domain-containing protein [Lederbergia wuyishanensis]|uniref:CMP-N-acetylneuraminic acid synthetase n=1 Tax=Lederbergia wuyishanensis TaxID=1347903 RepID=A0ABU0D8U7_9BACI|nr:acylneuraminate cytidylyltransferase family protein [Lederbergia wuyishanensis]MCJ8007611.1 acylneuraminate cytidylyltransferase family protein [Lederbergia wuyishanensis]MDQ0344805.1 CMP-N-acetylneuraminic acid synthetase [Lederbergia wuyishanensis]